jgi:CubicO group peptidase (beta-lactamase class C family)
MKQKLSSCAAAFICLLHLSCAAAAGLPAIPDAGRAALSDFLRQSVARGDVPALVALVANRDTVLFLDGAGKRDVANNAPIATDTIFRIASMTKPITSLGVMMLYEEGKIGLDDPVTKYLPEFEHVRVLTRFDSADGTYDTRPPARPITIRHLLTHTSGIGYAFSDARLAKIDDGKKAVADLPLLHDPGDKFTYGQNTAVLGRVVEKVAGQPLDAFLRARIFTPLDMHDTFFAVPADKVHRVVTVHGKMAGVLSERPNPASLQSPVRGDGGLFSTARDYGTFLQLFLNGGHRGATRLVSEASIRLMTSNQIGRVVVEQQPAADVARTAPFPLGAGKDKFGLGFQIESAPVADRGLRSEGSYSWGGINNTHFWVDPQKAVAAVVLMQVLPFYDESCIKVLRGFERIVYRELR